MRSIFALAREVPQVKDYLADFEKKCAGWQADLKIASANFKKEMANSEELQRRLDEELPSFAADWEERAALAMEPFVYAMPSNWGKAWGERQKVMDKTVRTQDLVERAKRKAEKAPTPAQKRRCDDPVRPHQRIVAALSRPAVRLSYR